MDTSYHQQLLEHTGKRIRFYRKLKKLSQDELATAIHKSESTLSKYERGAIAIDIGTLHDIARVLDVSISDLVDFNIPPSSKKPDGSGLFSGKDTLHIYYYNRHIKRFEIGLMQLDYSSSDGNSIPCRCYLDIPHSGHYEDCKYFCTGSMHGYNLVSYIDINNTTMKMDRMRLYIFNPYGRTAKAWELFTGISYGISSIFLHKTLISSEPIPMSVLDPTDFYYSPDELKQLKNLHLIRFDPLDNPDI
ncbi:MAG: helix-turn-helix transcriptional regulator [Clostridia bacterium]|nr:helix-turn-helix transcriptional regulator [Clostridia bacterium]MBQ7091555.1 helix-turn-helix transcriptional regulator [Clostridia bacterium]